jgi:hypothetical protein
MTLIEMISPYVHQSAVSSKQIVRNIHLAPFPKDQKDSQTLALKETTTQDFAHLFMNRFFIKDYIGTGTIAHSILFVVVVLHDESQKYHNTETQPHSIKVALLGKI